MTIIFPTMKDEGLGAKRGAHFGKATFYTAVSVEDGVVKEVKVHKNPGHVTGGCANAVANIQALGADTLVVSGIGGEPLKKFLAVNVSVYFDDQNETVEAALSDFLAGKTPKLTQTIPARIIKDEISLLFRLNRDIGAFRLINISYYLL